MAGRRGTHSHLPMLLGMALAVLVGFVAAWVGALLR
jgi:hypothetical protein